jgi:hypothetical protein
VTYIDTYAFFDCPSLTSIVIPNSVKSIHGAAFAHCINLSNIKIPKSVSYIGFNAFDGIKKVKPQYNANNTLRAFMAFFDDWTWWYSQYELGKSYHKNGKIVCDREHGNGFYACPNPLDVFNYSNGETDRYNFAEVELSGEMDWGKDMVAASDIRIVRKLTVSQLAEIYNEMAKD